MTHSQSDVADAAAGAEEQSERKAWHQPVLQTFAANGAAGSTFGDPDGLGGGVS